MLRRFKNFKVLAAMSAIVAMFAIAPVAHGGLSWVGIDPVLETEVGRVNIWVDWTLGNECSIDGPITMRAYIEDAELVSESVEVFDCGDGQATIETQTTVYDYGDEDELRIRRVHVPSDDYFPVRIRVYLDGDLIDTCYGVSNFPFSCRLIELGN